MGTTVSLLLMLPGRYFGIHVGDSRIYKIGKRTMEQITNDHSRVMQEVRMGTVSGKKEITKVKLSEEVVDPDDIEMLEDLIMAATNEALRQIDEQSQASMSKITGGLGGGLF